jgi:hypothetical protein
MIQSTIRGAGYFYEANRLATVSGSKKIRTFLRTSAIEFLRVCVQYHRIINELPFIYRERQIQSLLLPSLAKVTRAVIAEQPIRRKIGKKVISGRIDYWVFYEPYVFLIESKQSWQSVSSKRTRKDTKRAWSAALEQLKSISRNEMEQLSYSTKHIARIALIIVPCYQASKHKDKLIPHSEEAAIDILNTLSGTLKPAPNWSAVWAIHKRLQTNHEYEKERNEIYPFLAFLARVLR